MHHNSETSIEIDADELNSLDLNDIQLDLEFEQNDESHQNNNHLLNSNLSLNENYFNKKVNNSSTNSTKFSSINNLTHKDDTDYEFKENDFSLNDNCFNTNLADVNQNHNHFIFDQLDLKDVKDLNEISLQSENHGNFQIPYSAEIDSILSFQNNDNEISSTLKNDVESYKNFQQRPTAFIEKNSLLENQKDANEKENYFNNANQDSNFSFQSEIDLRNINMDINENNFFLPQEDDNEKLDFSLQLKNDKLHDSFQIGDNNDVYSFRANEIETLRRLNKNQQDELKHLKKRLSEFERINKETSLQSDLYVSAIKNEKDQLKIMCQTQKKELSKKDEEIEQLKFEFDLKFLTLKKDLTLENEVNFLNLKKSLEVQYNKEINNKDENKDVALQVGPTCEEFEIKKKKTDLVLQTLQSDLTKREQDLRILLNDLGHDLSLNLTRSTCGNQVQKLIQGSHYHDEQQRKKIKDIEEKLKASEENLVDCKNKINELGMSLHRLKEFKTKNEEYKKEIEIQLVESEQKIKNLELENLSLSQDIKQKQEEQFSKLMKEKEELKCQLSFMEDEKLKLKNEMNLLETEFKNITKLKREQETNFQIKFEENKEELKKILKNYQEEKKKELENIIYKEREKFFNEKEYLEKILKQRESEFNNLKAFKKNEIEINTRNLEEKYQQIISNLTKNYQNNLKKLKDEGNLLREKMNYEFDERVKEETEAYKDSLEMERKGEMENNLKKVKQEYLKTLLKMKEEVSLIRIRQQEKLEYEIEKRLHIEEEWRLRYEDLLNQKMNLNKNTQLGNENVVRDNKKKSISNSSPMKSSSKRSFGSNHNISSVHNSNGYLPSWKG
ncbi:hypothetical protein HK099_005437 [Clydaea vesicula]|uniref:Uncharacterized protein n=1 Tax=Clydaea vesicula TaxID=447962 RepID=A0AAD5U0C2_9FUNG|nr:hypothetical protein HK099_005437 [Clydaea vesicula]